MAYALAFPTFPTIDSYSDVTNEGHKTSQPQKVQESTLSLYFFTAIVIVPMISNKLSVEGISHSFDIKDGLQASEVLPSTCERSRPHRQDGPPFLPDVTVTPFMANAANRERI